MERVCFCAQVLLVSASLCLQRRLPDAVAGRMQFVPRQQFVQRVAPLEHGAAAKQRRQSVLRQPQNVAVQHALEQQPPVRLSLLGLLLEALELEHELDGRLDRAPAGPGRHHIRHADRGVGHPGRQHTVHAVFFWYDQALGAFARTTAGSDVCMLLRYFLSA